jgi:hypothetical protein
MIASRAARAAAAQAPAAMENRSSGSSGTTHPFGIILGGERRVPHPFREAADGDPRGRAAESLVTAHGGRVELATSPGKGATFRILLPVID